jgi:hypothetical protein
MPKKETDQSFEDAFDELAGDATSSPEEQMSIPDEPEEGEESVLVPETEEKEEAQAEGTIEPEAKTEEPVEEKTEEVAEEQPEEGLEDQLKTANAETQKWIHKYNSDLGRQNAYQKQIEGLKQQNNALRKQSSGEGNAKPDTLKEDYPDIAEGTDSRINRATEPLMRKIEELEEKLTPIQEKQQKDAIGEQYNQLEQEHPDYIEISKDVQFHNWLGAQPLPVQAMINSEDANEASYLLRLYKNDKGLVTEQEEVPSELKQRREKQLRQAQNVPSRGGRSQEIVPPNDDFDAAFDFFAKDQ